ncbi:hypothetical protein BU26DRAFT_583755 [Trematosphaeria pertusa]|uniref:Uncharacterized protein n=1 Tax=Trematosphaeria pertusa TaxID=390896 RepID=A0A6A6IX51_9PLEO|nr:uncharacterized protein BU26DRAFT_583755 [Trematosphaeria pertusa]KAF2255111.1 hypothetical protein BU26DRAFT_583755 [Trematosphaeria pertusa]
MDALEKRFHLENVPYDKLTLPYQHQNIRPPISTGRILAHGLETIADPSPRTKHPSLTAPTTSNHSRQQATAAAPPRQATSKQPSTPPACVPGSPPNPPAQCAAPRYSTPSLTLRGVWSCFTGSKGVG